MGWWVEGGGVQELREKVKGEEKGGCIHFLRPVLIISLLP